jgi:hypothetical protein
LKKAVFLLTTFSIWLISTSLIRSNSSSHETAVSTQERVKYIYVGMEKCASVCHNNKDMGFQYDIVRKSPHSNAFKILVSEKAGHYARKASIKENPQDSPVCLKCHVTGGGLDSTSFAATYRKDDGVTCEACHKGEYITKTFIPVEADCLKCHNNSVHRTSRFIFRDKLTLINHQRPKSVSPGI